MGFAKAPVGAVVVAVTIAMAFTVLLTNSSPVRNVPVQIVVSTRGKLTVATAPRGVLAPPVMEGTAGAAAFYIAFSRRGQRLGAQLVRMEAPSAHEINESVVTLTGEVVNNKLVLYPQGRHSNSARALGASGGRNRLVVTYPGAWRGKIVFHPGDAQVFATMQRQLKRNQ